jgi:pyruvate,water dikinase
MDRYGHRAVYESYLRNTRWSETPDYLFDTVVTLIDCEPTQSRERQKAELNAARQRLVQRLPVAHRLLVRGLLKLATTERNNRERARSALTAHLGVMRQIALELGRRLSGSAGLERVEDVFNLTLLELLAVAEGRMPIAAAARRASRRRKQLEVWASQAEPDVIIEHSGATAEPTATQGQAVSAPNVWRGTAVGGGRVRGRACVVRHPEAALAMDAGAILVTRSTDPSWTPMFLKASAVVTETGGYLSHGAIVARELGIPAVVNLPGILNHIGNGDLLEVDGGSGTVTRL